jgi:DNA-binding winged helix-turn-helix (wHTH) protein
LAEGDPRRRLLARSDAFLERIERLRLQGSLRVPAQLWEQIVRLAAEAGEAATPPTPVTLAAAHRYLFRLQGWLLSRVPPPAGPTAESAVRQAPIPRLALPLRHRAVTEAEWREQIRLVAQRARDSARYLDAQAQAADTDPAGADLAVLRRDQAERARQGSELLLSQAERASGRAPELEAAPDLPTTGRLQLENVVIDLDRQEVRQDDRLVPLTPIERACLVALAANPGRVLTREAMLHLVYGDDPRIDIHSQALNVHLSHVRQKLGRPAWLGTVTGIGFRVLPAREAGELPSIDMERVRQQRRERRLAWARGSSGSPPPPSPTPGATIERRPGR